MKFTLYVKTGCPWCVEAVNYLRERGYPFEEVDVLKDASAFERMVDLSGQSLAPTLLAGELVLPDFDVGELEAFLGENDISSEDVEGDGEGA